MKTWFAVLSVAALLCGSVACNRHNDTYSSRTANDRQARSDLGTTGTGTTGAGTASRDLTGRTGTDVGAEADTGTPGSNATGRTGAMGSTPGTQQGQRTLTGKLTVKDPTAHTFQLDNNGATYVAPSQTNLGQFDGVEVTVQIDENGRVQTIENRNGGAADRPG